MSGTDNAPAGAIFSSASTAGTSIFEDGFEHAQKQEGHPRDFDSDGARSKSPQRARRRPPAASDHVKHRRTRSGCYTCRSRRVKCDETRPVCDRCRKGSRECLFPPPRSTTKPAPQTKAGQRRDLDEESGSSSDTSEDTDAVASADVRHPSNVLEWQRKQAAVVQSRASKDKAKVVLQDQVRNPSVTTETSLSPFTDGSVPSTTTSMSLISSAASPGEAVWSYLPQDIRFYLEYHQSHLSYHHYSFFQDNYRFFHTLLIDAALTYNPLLYAVVAFAAFHHTLAKQDGTVAEFLGYYNKSLSLLRKSLQSKQRHTDATIMTVLQLATFEEYLGDWVNLAIHQAAALDMIQELYTPETVVQTETRRKILDWYNRFDLLTSLMGGHDTRLDKDWYEAYAKWYERASRSDPSSIPARIEWLNACTRVNAAEMARLQAGMKEGRLSPTDIMQQSSSIGQKHQEWKREMDQVTKLPGYLLTPRPEPSEIQHDKASPFPPGAIYHSDLWAVNFLLLVWYGAVSMPQYQTALAMQQPVPKEVEEIAVAQAMIYEAIDIWPMSPPGSVIPMQACLGLICIFLPREEKYSRWCRQKLAKVENIGLTFPQSFRSQMAEQWNSPELNHWWLPGEESYRPIVRSIRSFIEQRTVKPRDQSAEDVRNMTSLFPKLSLQDVSSPESLE